MTDLERKMSSVIRGLGVLDTLTQAVTDDLINTKNRPEYLDLYKAEKDLEDISERCYRLKKEILEMQDLIEEE